MPNEPAWLSAEQVITINRKLVAATGEPFALRDQGLLESACAKPANHWHYGEEDVATLACALLFGIARNHPFTQGNKRTAFAAATVFLQANGYGLEAPDTAEFADALVAVIEHRVEEAEFADFFREFLVELKD